MSMSSEHWMISNVEKEYSDMEEYFAKMEGHPRTHVHEPVCKTWQGSTRSCWGRHLRAGAEIGAAFQKLGQTD